MKYYLFDYNGTIIDDVDLSIECINYCITRYLKRPLLDKQEYLACFSFPVKNYYEKVGFDFNELSWEEVSHVWMNYYLDNVHRCKLHDGVEELLKKNMTDGSENIVLSASEINNLRKQLTDFGILPYFSKIYGLDNIYAHSKLANGLEFIKGKNKKDCLMIGDSAHDFEVAKAMGIECVLVCKGHQDKESLLKLGCPVYDDIREIR